MIKSKKQSLIVIGAFILTLLLGTTTYAFFNYTRTGSNNVIRTGQINFSTSQSNTLNLTNVFPMSASDAQEANLDAVEIRIVGDTAYSNGEEYEITIEEVNNTIGSGANAKVVPINYLATYSATPVQSGPANVIGTSSENYYADRLGTTAVYKLNSTGLASDGKQVLVGFIPKDVSVDGTLTIKAYIDTNNILISDTYPEEETDTNSDGYIDGTPTSMGEGKVVLTTSEWNSLQNTAISFKIKAVSQEGIWMGKVDSCPGCKFMYTPDVEMYTTWEENSNGTTTTLTSGLYDSYLDVKDLNDNHIFVGLLLNESNQATRAYACAIKNDVPFCIEGTRGASHESNKSILQGPNLWNNTCTTTYRYGYEIISCSEMIGDDLYASTTSGGYAEVGVGYNDCFADDTGRFVCWS